MKRGDRANIIVNDRTLEATYLGKGRHAKAYRVNDEVYLYVVDCFMKEALVGIRAPHIPVIEQLDSQVNRRGDDVQVFKMPYYEPVSARYYPEAWAIMKELEKCRDLAFHAVFIKQRELHRQHGHTAPRWDFLGQEIAYKTISLANIPRSVADSLMTMADAIANYGQGCTFEFSRRNTSVDSKGEIIFRDICFDAGKAVLRAQEIIRRREARGRY